MQKSYNSLEEIEWTPKNILMITFALLVLIGGFGYGIVESEHVKEEKREKLRAMSLEEVGHYIIEHNDGTVHIDIITKVKNIHLVGNTLEFPFYLTNGFLKKISTKIIGGVESHKKLIQEDTLKEDCSKTTFKVFLEKGGIMHYTYKVVKNKKETFLFDFNNTNEMCPKNTY